MNNIFIDTLNALALDGFSITFEGFNKHGGLTIIMKDVGTGLSVRDVAGPNAIKDYLGGADTLISWTLADMARELNKLKDETNADT